jgi:hypothetical protein
MHGDLPSGTVVSVSRRHKGNVVIKITKKWRLKELISENNRKGIATLLVVVLISSILAVIPAVNAASEAEINNRNS